MIRFLFIFSLTVLMVTVTTKKLDERIHELQENSENLESDERHILDKLIALKLAVMISDLVDTYRMDKDLDIKHSKTQPFDPLI